MEPIPPEAVGQRHKHRGFTKMLTPMNRERRERQCPVILNEMGANWGLRFGTCLAAPPPLWPHPPPPAVLPERSSHPPSGRTGPLSHTRGTRAPSWSPRRRHAAAPGKRSHPIRERGGGQDPMPRRVQWESAVPAFFLSLRWGGRADTSVIKVGGTSRVGRG